MNYYTRDMVKFTGPSLTRDNLNYMWDLYIAGEFGGANEVFPEIAALTEGPDVWQPH